MKQASVNFHTLTLMENTLIKCLLFSLLWVLQYSPNAVYLLLILSIRLI